MRALLVVVGISRCVGARRGTQGVFSEKQVYLAVHSRVDVLGLQNDPAGARGRFVYEEAAGACE